MGKQPKQPKKPNIMGISKVSRGGKTRFQVQHAGKYIGFFSCLKSAKEAKAKAREQNQRARPIEGTSKFRGVVKRERGEGILYQAQVYDAAEGAMRYLGAADSAEKAADILVEHVGAVSRTQIKTEKHLRFKSDEVIERFKILMGIYTNPDGSPAVMSDITSAINNKIANPTLSVHAPALYFMSILGKDGPWKDAVAKRWKAAFLLTSNVSVIAKQSVLSECEKTL